MQDLKIYKLNDKYFFNVGAFCSRSHYFLCSSLRSAYNSPYEACFDGHQMIKNKSFHVHAMNKFAQEEFGAEMLKEISADEMLYSHHLNIYNFMSEKIKGILHSDEDGKKVAYGEIKSIVKEILTINSQIDDKDEQDKMKKLIGKYSKLVKKYLKKYLDEDIEKMKDKGTDEMVNEDELTQSVENEVPPNMQLAFKNHIDSITKHSQNINFKEFCQDLLEYYSLCICESIRQMHQEIVFEIDQKHEVIRIIDGKETILMVGYNEEDFLIDRIIPVGDLSKLCPFDSLKFYQKYWKPIVEKIGHFHFLDLNCLFVNGKSRLPDAPMQSIKDHNIEGWNIAENCIRPIEICLDSKSNSWDVHESVRIVSASSKFTEQDFLQDGKPARVLCIDPELGVVYGKFGEVVEVIPMDNGLELMVNFGRHIQRVREDQIEKVDND